MGLVTDVSDAIADSLQAVGWYAGASIFPERLTRQLGDRALVLDQTGALRQATTRHEDARGTVRRDETHWLADTPDDEHEKEALAHLHDLRGELNRALYLGAHDVQLHFARYAEGAFYKTHRDVFRDDDSRLVSIVFYLNPSWAHDAGGELVLYEADDGGAEITRVLPRAGTMVCFLSDRFPHEVLPATRERYSLTGWFRQLVVDGQSLRHRRQRP